ncbi:MAG TPA: phosphomannomutase/phosphoglucomutase [Ruminiclostridium sp.]
MGIYKECDIRGIYPSDLDEQQAYNIGRAVGTLMKGKTLVVGGDVRLSTPSLKKMLQNGLRESGADIIDIGTVPTPVFYFSLKRLSADGGVMVTASHNPAKYNGFKLMLGETPITADVIKNIEKLVKAQNYSTGDGEQREVCTQEDYIKSITETFNKGKLKVVLDCCNGVTGYLAPLLFNKLGYETIGMYTEFDGSFPNRDPNPSVYENLSALKKEVVRTRADFGVAFDGDGDRVVFVDNMGKVIESERTFAIFIKEYLKYEPSNIVFDIKSSSVVHDTVVELGGTPLMERSGHTFIKRRFLESEAALAGEISGHFFFKELGYDDGIFAALKLAEIIGNKGDLSKLADEIPKTIITPDIRIHCSYNERDNWLNRVSEAGQQYKITLMDGVRVEFPKGWLLMRKSVTEESITLRIEAKDETILEEIKGWILKVIPEIKIE